MAKILILEADRLLADNLARYLRNSGHSVFWSGGPQAAIEKSDLHHPDVIVMDLVLGGHSGVEFLYELRSYPEWQALPVVIFSSIAASDVAAGNFALSELNITQFCYKPEIKLEDFAKIIDRVTQLAPIEAGAEKTK